MLEKGASNLNANKKKNTFFLDDVDSLTLSNERTVIAKQRL